MAAQKRVTGPHFQHGMAQTSTNQPSGPPLQSPSRLSLMEHSMPPSLDHSMVLGRPKLISCRRRPQRRSPLRPLNCMPSCFGTDREAPEAPKLYQLATAETATPQWQRETQQKKVARRAEPVTRASLQPKAARPYSFATFAPSPPPHALETADTAKVEHSTRTKTAGDVSIRRFAQGSRIVAQSDTSEQLKAIFRAHAPSKLANVPDLLKKYAGREEELLRKVRRKYRQCSKQSPSRPKTTCRAHGKAKATHKDQLVALLRVHAPSKLGNVTSLLQKYAGREEELLAGVRRKYNVQR